MSWVGLSALAQPFADWVYEPRETCYARYGQRLTGGGQPYPRQNTPPNKKPREARGFG